MEPSKEIMDQLHQMKEKLPASDVSSVVEGDFFKQFTFQRGYLLTNWSESELKVIDAIETLQKIDDKINSIKSECTSKENLLSEKRQPFLFKKRHEEFIATTRAEIEQLELQIKDLETEKVQIETILSPNTKIISKIDDVNRSIAEQYIVDANYFAIETKIIENEYYQNIFKEFPYEKMKSTDISEKIESIKTYLTKYYPISRKLNWRNSLYFVYFICINMDNIDPKYSVILNGNAQNLKERCDRIISEFANESGEQFKGEVEYWVVRLYAYCQPFFHYDSNNVLSEMAHQLEVRDSVRLGEYIVDTVMKSDLLKQVLKEIGNSIKAGKEIAIKQNDEVHLNYFIEQEREIMENKYISLFSSFGICM